MYVCKEFNELTFFLRLTFWIWSCLKIPFLYIHLLLNLTYDLKILVWYNHNLVGNLENAYERIDCSRVSACRLSNSLKASFYFTRICLSFNFLNKFEVDSRAPRTSWKKSYLLAETAGLILVKIEVFFSRVSIKKEEI